MVKVRCPGLSWVFSAVYASPKLVERSILWDNLGKVAKSHTLPWVIAGDFNEPLFANEKFGGRHVFINKALLFKECLDTCNMIDLGFLGPRYTWTNQREVGDLIQERLD